MFKKGETLEGAPGRPRQSTRRQQASGPPSGRPIKNDPAELPKGLSTSDEARTTRVPAQVRRLRPPGGGYPTAEHGRRLRASPCFWLGRSSDHLRNRRCHRQNTHETPRLCPSGLIEPAGWLRALSASLQTRATCVTGPRRCGYKRAAGVLGSSPEVERVVSFYPAADLRIPAGLAWDFRLKALDLRGRRRGSAISRTPSRETREARSGPGCVAPREVVRRC